MTLPITFTVDIVPRSVQHGARAKRQRGKTIFFSDEKKMAYHASIARLTSGHAPPDPFDGPLRIKLAFFMPRPKGRPERVSAELWRSGDPAPYETRGRGDLDNLMKSFVDGLQGFWFDDGQIVEAQLSKHYHERGGAPRVEVQIQGHEDEEGR